MTMALIAQRESHNVGYLQLRPATLEDLVAGAHISTVN
jgi:hypothetical protein